MTCSYEQQNSSKSSLHNFVERQTISSIWKDTFYLQKQNQTTWTFLAIILYILVGLINRDISKQQDMETDLFHKWYRLKFA